MEISKSIFLPTNSTQVFEALARGELFRAQGMIEESFQQDFQEAGEYSFRRPSRDECQGVYKQIMPGKGVIMSYGDSHLSITLKVLTRGTELTLLHEGESVENWDEALEQFSRAVVPASALLA